MYGFKRVNMNINSNIPTLLNATEQLLNTYVHHINSQIDKYFKRKFILIKFLIECLSLNSDHVNAANVLSDL